MLVAILMLYFLQEARTSTFDYPPLTCSPDRPGPSGALFLAFALAFAIKVPLVPFHTWLPLAHVEAPTAGSVILAGVLLKMGTYGFLRFCLPLFPDAAVGLPPVIVALARGRHSLRRVGVDVQADIKKLVAYSSVSHLGFVMLGLFTFNAPGLAGGILQMINHGLSTGACSSWSACSTSGTTRGTSPTSGASGPSSRCSRSCSWCDVLLHRPAGPERLRGRVPDPGGRLPVEPSGGRPRHRRDRLRRRRPPLDVPAGDLRGGPPRGEPRLPDLTPREIGTLVPLLS